MIQGLLYKEWIKTRWALLVLYIVGLAITAYALLTLQRVITLRGAAHLWEILLSKDVLFLNVLQYQPLFTGLVLAVTQFAPEMTRKRLKLTLHLPMNQGTIALTMLTYGVGVLGLLCLTQHLMLALYLRSILAPELVTHLLVSTAPWFIAGFTAYGLTALVVLEPTWRRRVLYILLSYALVHFYFISTTPRFYQEALLPMGLVTLLLCYVSILSIQRFKEGVQ